MLLKGWGRREIGWVTVGALAGFVIGLILGLLVKGPAIGRMVKAALAAGGGLLVALYLGHHAARFAVQTIRRGRGQTLGGKRRARWVGGIERFFFFIAAAVSPPVAFGGVVGWAGLKLGANWGSREAETARGDETIRIGRISALVGTLASLGMAVVGGLIARWGLCL